MKARLGKLMEKPEIRHGLILVCFGLLLWVGRYALSSQFGLYTDDYSRIPETSIWNFSDLVSTLWEQISKFKGQGRPLHETFIYFFSFLSWKLGGLNSAYFLSFLILFLNTCLFYAFSHRIGKQAFAIISTLAFILYFADTSQTLLTHSFGIQTAITLFLLGANCYLRKKFFWAYLFLFLQLFTYEAVFLAFLVMPIFLFEPWKKTWKRLLPHIVIMGGFLMTSFLLRRFLGESRVVSLSSVDLVRRILVHLFNGVLFNVVSLGMRILVFFRELSTLPLIISLILSPGVIGLLWLANRRSGEAFEETLQSSEERNASTDLSHRKKFLRIFLAAVAMFLLAYALNFTLRADVVNGRDTRVHTAASIGYALLIGLSVLHLFKVSSRKWLILGLWGIFFSVLAGFGVHLQQAYAESWDLQQEFWTELLPLIPDAKGGTVVLISPEGMQNPVEIDANTWNLPRMLEQIVVLPPDMVGVPRVYLLGEDWQNCIIVEGLISLNGGSTYAPPKYYKFVDEERIIFISTSGDVLERRQAPLPLGDREIVLPEPGDPVLPYLSEGPLFDLLILQD
jgi:hypothetical protein